MTFKQRKELADKYKEWVKQPIDNNQTMILDCAESVMAFLDINGYLFEVVRCKDCKYICHYTDGHLECRLLADLKPIPTTYCTMNVDDFCSYGERREYED